jgi:insulysin
MMMKVCAFVFMVPRLAVGASFEGQINPKGEFLTANRNYRGDDFLERHQVRRAPGWLRNNDRLVMPESPQGRLKSEIPFAALATNVGNDEEANNLLDKAYVGVEDQMLSEKAKGDPREYKMVVLANGVKLLAIQDKTAQQAAFATSVTAGQFYDPPEFLGLAHLCEHAVFLGTEKYPMRTGFDEFLARHGGSTNAYTAAESTVYYASLDHKAFDEAIDRFADFFRAPLFNTSTVWDEIRAVESEHSKNMNSIQWRTERAMFSLANPQNPIEWFHTGDHESLEGNGKEKLGDALRKYFNEHYCPHRLNVVTFGKDPVEKQVAMVQKSFGVMKRHPECKAQPSSFASVTPFKAERLGNWLHIDGANPVPQLWLLFPMDNIQPMYKSKPLTYVRRLLSYEGENSLLYALDTKLQLAKTLSVSSDDTSAGSMLWLRADLTADGLKNPTAVLDTIFAYIAKVRRHSLDSDQLETVKRDAELDWDWREPADAETTIQDFAELMTRYPAAELLSGDALIQEPNAEVVARVMERIVPENMNVGVAELNPDWGSHEVKTIPHYGSQYVMYPMSQGHAESVSLWKRWLSKDTSQQEIDSELLARLQKVDPTLQDLPKMELPEKIRTTKGAILMDHAQSKRGESDIERVFGKAPKEIAGESTNSADQLFYREGWMVSGPRVEAKFYLRPKVDRHDKDAEKPVSRILNSIGIDLLGKNLRARLAKHVNSGTSYSLSVSPGGITLSVIAFQPDLERFAKQVLLEVERGVSAPQKMYDRAWADLNQKLNICEGPLVMAGKTMDILLRTDEFDENEQLDVLEDSAVSRPAVEKYMGDLWNSSFQLTSLVFGDISEADAKKVTKSVMLQLGSLGTKVDVNANEVERVSPVVRPARPLEFRGMNPCAHNTNHVYRTRVFLGSPSVQQRVLLGILKPVIKELSFSELRTKSGLGYIVGSDVTPMSNVMTLECFVQGEVMMPDDLELQCERVWAKAVPERINNMSSDEFDSLKASFQAELLSPTNGHEEELNHFSSSLLMDKCGEMDAEMLMFLETVKSKDEVLAEWRASALPEGALRTRVSVKYFGHGGSNSRGSEKDVPTPEMVTENARKLGLDEATVTRLAAERKVTSPLFQANSKVRKVLHHGSSFFSEDVYCKVSDRENEESSVRTHVNKLDMSASLLEFGVNSRMTGRGPRPELPRTAFNEQPQRFSSLRPFRPRAVSSLHRISSRAEPVSNQ